MSKTSKTIFLLIPIFLCGSFFIYNNFVYASGDINHIVISEIQISSVLAQEFKFKEGEIKEEINKKVGYNLVRKIKFEI